jgi:pimeloyl-ACP methyl ester carboxylesterase
MRLYVHSWGPASAGRIAILIHGVTSWHRTWTRAAPLLVAHGYRVLAPDLRGHGNSPRASSYRPEDFAADVVESLPAGADLAIGHSLGGRTLAHALDGLRPGRAAYIDPAFRLSPRRNRDIEAALAFVGSLRNMTATRMTRMNPRWPAEAVTAELTGSAQSDPAVMPGLADWGDFVPEPSVPSLVQVADPSFLIPADFAADLAGRGFAVRLVTGARHCIHHDDIDAFMSGLDGWI